MITIDTLSSATLFATPLLVAGAGELVVERAGVVNIGIEGMMLTGALAAWVVNGHVGPGTGVLAGVGAAMILGLLFALAAVWLAADQIVSGTGINLLALGGTALASKALGAKVPAGTAISQWPMAIVAVILMAGVWAFMRFTRAGMELTAIGEAPRAADSAGIAVNRRRLAAVLFGSACAGLAGAYLSTMRVLGFTENMTEGQGFLALAMVIFGRWNALGVLLAGIFFGLVRAMANEAEAQRGLIYPLVRWLTGFLKEENRSAALQLLKALPYVVTLAALAGLAGRSRAPAELGKGWERE